MLPADDLLHTVRSQLDVDESRAAEVSRLLNIVGSTLAKMKETTGATGCCSLSPS